MFVSFTSAMWFFAALLSAAGFFVYRKRKRALSPPRLSDEDINRLIRGESVTLPGPEEPTDMDEVRKAEDDFWKEERWDSAEPF